MTEDRKLSDAEVIERAKTVANALVKVSDLLKKGLFLGIDGAEVATAVSFCDNFSSQIIKDLAKGEEKGESAPVSA